MLYWNGMDWTGITFDLSSYAAFLSWGALEKAIGG